MSPVRAWLSAPIITVWRSGSAGVSKTLSGGSIPSTVAKRIIMSETLGKLREIQLEVDSILSNAYVDRLEGSINWGDLRCVNVSQCLNVYNEVYYTVEIEEASPTAYKLQEYVFYKLFEKYPELDIRVSTEW